jgi:hypothetical protein
MDRRPRDQVIKSVIGQIVTSPQIAQSIPEYIEDERLSRNSRDRFHAVVDAITALHSSVSEVTLPMKDDQPELTLHYALEAYEQDTHNMKNRDVLRVLCNQQGLNPQVTLMAWRLNHRRSTGLIDAAKKLMVARQKRIRSVHVHRILTSFTTLVILVLLQFFITPHWIILSLITANSTLLIHWFRINRNPKFPHLQEFRPFFYLNSGVVIYSVLDVLNRIFMWV